MLSVINKFECVKNFRSEFTLIDIIVLGSNMDHKLDASIFNTLGYRLNLLDINFSLDLVFLDVIKRLISQKKNSALLLHPSIDLDNDTREDNFLTLCCIKLGLNLWVSCATTMVLEFARS